MHAQSHQSDPRILGRRTLQRDHRHLDTLLGPGLSVLDVGCGTGTITAGIAEAVGPRGLVIGVDRDSGLLEIARREHGAIANLRFDAADVSCLPFHSQFDVVTAARVLQWISDPGQAVMQMREACRPSGIVAVLDYNHEANQWEPDPPAEFQEFYRAFLAWRASHHWDNRMADHLPELLQRAGLIHIESHVQDEVAVRGGPHFEEQAALWPQVIDNIGGQLCGAGFLTESRLRQAGQQYRVGAQTELRKQTLNMRTVTGRLPTPRARIG